MFCFFFSSRRRHTRLQGDWSSDVCSSDLDCEFHIRRLRKFIVHQKIRNDRDGIRNETRPAGREDRVVNGIDPRRSEERRVGKECRGGWAPCEETGKGEERENGQKGRCECD